MTSPHAVIFDAYGTLLDVHAAMAAHAPLLGADWARISQDWRSKQLEYSWVRSLAGRHCDFWDITRAALDHVAARYSLTDRAVLDDVLAAYRTLSAYPEVSGMLDRLRGAGIGRAILSNGDPDMLADAIAAAGIGDLLDDVLSVQALAIYKPAPRVYQLAIDRYGVPAARLAFVSSNAWDAFGALCFGMQVFWVNRAGQPDEYGLRGNVTELPDLTTLAARIA